MKIAILTHPLGANYGGILQNYALQVVLKELNHEPITLNYYLSTPWKVKVFSFIHRVAQRISGRRVPLRSWLKKKEYLTITKYTRDFINNNINITDSFNLLDLGKVNLSDINAIIVGSDQVWRGSDVNVTKFFLADFENIDILKISYAASFGVDYWEFNQEFTERCRKLIKNFTAVSVRELSGVKLCQDMLGRCAEFVLDPTLLIDRLYYDQFIEQKREMCVGTQSYILSYVLDQDERKQNIVNSVSKTLSLEIKSVIPPKYFREVGSAGLSECVYPPVEEWLAGIRDASYVITDSFHGTVFSIIYKKPFISISNKKRGTERMSSLLSLLHLEDRLVESHEIAMEILSQPIDYQKVDNILKDNKEKSIKFITNSLL